MRRTLKKKEVARLLQEYGFLKTEPDSTLQFDDKQGIFYAAREIIFFRKDNIMVPFLKSKSIDWKYFPTIKVDMPAVPFMTKGADLLRPGIVYYDSFDKDDIIIVRDEKNSVALAVMKAIVGSTDLEGMEKGKVALSLHHVNDRMWKENH